MQKKTDQIKTRPYWHIDAKWFCGLAFMFVFGINLFVAGLYVLTNEKNGIDIMTKMITLSFSRDGVDSTKDIDEFMKKIEAAPNKTIKPIPALNITVSKAELEGKTPREMRYMIFRKIVTPIYFNGKGAEEILNTPEARVNFEKDTTLLSIFSERSHKIIGRILFVLSVFSAILLGLVAYFSYRFGRLATPGTIIILSTWFWALFFFIVKTATQNVKELKLPIPSETGGNEYAKAFTPFIREIAPDIAMVFATIYLYALMFGFGLLLIAGIGKLFTRFQKS